MVNMLVKISVNCKKFFFIFFLHCYWLGKKRIDRRSVLIVSIPVQWYMQDWWVGVTHCQSQVVKGRKAGCRAAYEGWEAGHAGRQPSPSARPPRVGFHGQSQVESWSGAPPQWGLGRPVAVPARYWACSPSYSSFVMGMDHLPPKT